MPNRLHKPTSELICRLEIARATANPVRRLPAPAGDVCRGDHPGAVNLPCSRSPGARYQHIISMSLFASGVASIIQIKAWARSFRTALHPGTSFNFVAPLIMGGTP